MNTRMRLPAIKLFVFLMTLFSVLPANTMLAQPVSAWADSARHVSFGAGVGLGELGGAAMCATGHVDYSHDWQLYRATITYSREFPSLFGRVEDPRNAVVRVAGMFGAQSSFTLDHPIFPLLGLGALFGSETDCLASVSAGISYSTLKLRGAQMINTGVTHPGMHEQIILGEIGVQLELDFVQLYRNHTIGYVHRFSGNFSQSKFAYGFYWGVQVFIP